MARHDLTTCTTPRAFRSRMKMRLSGGKSLTVSGSDVRRSSEGRSLARWVPVREAEGEPWCTESLFVLRLYATATTSSSVRILL